MWKGMIQSLNDSGVRAAVPYNMSPEERHPKTCVSETNRLFLMENAGATDCVTDGAGE